METPKSLLLYAATEIKRQKLFDFGGKPLRSMTTDELADGLLAFYRGSDGNADLSEKTVSVLRDLAEAYGQKQDASANADTPKKKREKRKMPEDLTSRDALEYAAVDMNTVMCLEPGIDIYEESDADFRRKFALAAFWAARTDNFKDYTWQVLRANGLDPDTLDAMTDAELQKRGFPKRNRPQKAETANKEPTKPKRTKEEIKEIIKAKREAHMAKKRAQEAAIQEAAKRVPVPEEDMPQVAEIQLEDVLPAEDVAEPVAKRVTLIGAIADYCVEKYNSKNRIIEPLKLLERLALLFPDRAKMALVYTVAAQIASKKLRKSGFDFDKAENGEYRVTKIPPDV